MTDTIVIWGFDGTTEGISRPEAETLATYLLTGSDKDGRELGARIRGALDGPGGEIPIRLELDDVPLLRAALDGAEVGGHRGLVVLQRAVGAEPPQDSTPI